MTNSGSLPRRHSISLDVAAIWLYISIHVAAEVVGCAEQETRKLGKGQFRHCYGSFLFKNVNVFGIAVQAIPLAPAHFTEDSYLLQSIYCFASGRFTSLQELRDQRHGYDRMIRQ